MPCNLFKQGHCEATCNKWNPVPNENWKPYPRFRHRYRLEFDDSIACTCGGGCTLPGCPKGAE